MKTHINYIKNKHMLSKYRKFNLLNNLNFNLIDIYQLINYFKLYNYYTCLIFSVKKLIIIFPIL